MTAISFCIQLIANGVTFGVRVFTVASRVEIVSAWDDRSDTSISLLSSCLLCVQILYVYRRQAECIFCVTLCIPHYSILAPTCFSFRCTNHSYPSLHPLPDVPVTIVTSPSTFPVPILSFVTFFVSFNLTERASGLGVRYLSEFRVLLLCFR